MSSPDILNDDLTFPQVEDVDLSQNMPRWIMASARYYFYQRRKFPMFFEHAGTKTLSDKINSYIEFRLDGPYVRKITKAETYYDIEINVLCIAPVTANNSDGIEDILGNMMSIFNDAHFDVRKYGDHDTDDDSLIGCMFLQTGHNEEIRVSRFGQANPDTKVSQASVEGHYRMRLFKSRS